jgi:tetratricopeptide (TPR) repeat protein
LPDTATPPSGNKAAGSTVLFQQAIEGLVSPQSSFNDRQIALEQLRKTGKLDQAITDLEQRLADNPHAADTAAALGRVYLQKCGTIQDVREQGILAMKADQVFDAALNLDASNWEARFTKAVAMSYWPTQMNRGTEVIQHFSTLIEQQERQVPQPHFAMSYAWLGDEYQKYGHTDQARQIWQRGTTLFPDNQELAKKLARP